MWASRHTSAPSPPPHRFQDLDDCSEDISLRHQLWASRQSWAELTEGLLSSQFEQVRGVRGVSRGTASLSRRGADQGA